jgi:hypothetical protein
MSKDNAFQQHLKHLYKNYSQIAEDYRTEIKGLIYFNLANEVAHILKDYSTYYKKHDE